MRIALAKMLVRKPGLLLRDEPTNHLDLAIQSSNGQTNTGNLIGPWILWTDSAGNQCATGAAVSQKLAFYPVSCPPVGVPAVS